MKPPRWSYDLNIVMKPHERTIWPEHCHEAVGVIIWSGPWHGATGMNVWPVHCHEATWEDYMTWTLPWSSRCDHMIWALAWSHRDDRMTWTFVWSLGMIIWPEYCHEVTGIITRLSLLIWETSCNVLIQKGQLTIGVNLHACDKFTLKKTYMYV